MGVSLLVVAQVQLGGLGEAREVVDDQDRLVLVLTQVGDDPVVRAGDELQAPPAEDAMFLTYLDQVARNQLSIDVGARSWASTLTDW